MVGRPRHRRLLRPFVGGRVVFVGDAARLAAVPAAEHVEFAVGGHAVELLIGLREWGALLPGRGGHLRQRGRDDSHAGDHHRQHGGSSFQHVRHEWSPFTVVDTERATAMPARDPADTPEMQRRSCGRRAYACVFSGGACDNTRRVSSDTDWPRCRRRIESKRGHLVQACRSSDWTSRSLSDAQWDAGSANLLTVASSRS